MGVVLRRMSRFGSIALSLVLLGVMGTGCAAEQPEVSQQVQDYYDNHVATPMALTTSPPERVPVEQVHLDPALLQPGTKTVFFGDSWTAGYAAEPSEQGYAYLAGDELGWSNTVMGLSGTGYLDPGPNEEGTFQQRLEAMPVDDSVQVFVLQGSINDGDRALVMFRDAANATLDVAKAKFPAAQIIILGPAPALVPASGAVSLIDQTLQSVASERGLPYISPVMEDWINIQNYGDIIDITVDNHPDTEGHQYLSGRVTEAIRALAK